MVGTAGLVCAYALTDAEPRRISEKYWMRFIGDLWDAYVDRSHLPKKQRSDRGLDGADALWSLPIW